MGRLIASISIILFCVISLVIPYSVVNAQGELSASEQSLCTSSGNKLSDDKKQCIVQDGERPLTGSPDSFINVFTNLLLYIAGAIAVIVIIVGGIRYITSTGDAMRIKQAKDTILYGIVGLIVAIIAWAIVNYIVDTLS